MNKRKIMMVALSLCMVAILAVGGSLAYLMDTDAQTNVFTVGNVTIDLYEDFGDNDGIEKLIPAVGSAQDGTLQNGVKKEVYVENTGSENAYVRVHIAIPTILDDGDPTFNASANTLHFNFSEASVAEGKWDWSTSGDDGVTAGNWNYYTTKVNGIDYNVYVVTYTTALEKGKTTVDAIHQVYLDSKTTNEQITAIKNVLGDEWKILVVAEAAQAEGFTDAYTALNTAFGVPGTEYKIDFASQVAENKTSEDLEVDDTTTQG